MCVFFFISGNKNKLPREVLSHLCRYIHFYGEIFVPILLAAAVEWTVYVCIDLNVEDSEKENKRNLELNNL